jgi:predicted transcriptional regulator
MKKILFTFPLFLFVSCAGQSLTDKGREVRTRAPSFGSCKKLQRIQGVGASLKDVYVNARNKTAALGGNYVDIGVPRASFTQFEVEADAYVCEPDKIPEF